MEIYQKKTNWKVRGTLIEATLDKDFVLSLPS